MTAMKMFWKTMREDFTPKRVAFMLASVGYIMLVLCIEHEPVQWIAMGGYLLGMLYPCDTRKEGNDEKPRTMDEWLDWHRKNTRHDDELKARVMERYRKRKSDNKRASADASPAE